MYLSMFNLCYLLLIWSYGIYLFDKNEINWKKVCLNPGFLSTIVGMIIFILPIGWPDVISKGFEMIGKMTIPLSMIVIGSLIANMKLHSFLSAIKYGPFWKIVISQTFNNPFILNPLYRFICTALLTINCRNCLWNAICPNDCPICTKISSRCPFCIVRRLINHIVMCHNDPDSLYDRIPFF